MTWACVFIELLEETMASKQRQEPRLPAAALHRALSRARQLYGLAWDELAERLGISFRTLIRLLAAQDLSLSVADGMAVRLGLHPVLLWPDHWPCSGAVGK